MPQYLKDLLAKIGQLLQSRKFYALLVALLLAGQTYAQGKVDAFEFLIVALGALSVYMGASAFEDAARARARQP